jgi:hypothetical protein
MRARPPAKAEVSRTRTLCYDFVPMSDDFGTINARRGDRAKEIEVLRRHRESLVKMLDDVDAKLRELEIWTSKGSIRSRA